MTYFTILNKNGQYILDSISSSWELLHYKFPEDKIYYSDIPLKSIYISKEQLRNVS